MNSAACPPWFLNYQVHCIQVFLSYVRSKFFLYFLDKFQKIARCGGLDLSPVMPTSKSASPPLATLVSVSKDSEWWLAFWSRTTATKSFGSVWLQLTWSIEAYALDGHPGGWQDVSQQSTLAHRLRKDTVFAQRESYFRPFCPEEAFVSASCGLSFALWLIAWMAFNVSSLTLFVLILSPKK